MDKHKILVGLLSSSVEAGVFTLNNRKLKISLACQWLPEARARPSRAKIPHEKTFYSIYECYFSMHGFNIPEYRLVSVCFLPQFAMSLQRVRVAMKWVIAKSRRDCLGGPRVCLVGWNLVKTKGNPSGYQYSSTSHSIRTNVLTRQ